MYTFLLDDLRARILTDRGVASMFIAAGSKDTKLPDLDEACTRFDELLDAPFVDEGRTPEDLELLRALGLRR